MFHDRCRNATIGFITFSSTPTSVPFRKDAHKRNLSSVVLSKQRKAYKKPIACTVQSVPSIYRTTDVRISNTPEWKMLEEHAQKVSRKVRSCAEYLVHTFLKI